MDATTVQQRFRAVPIEFLDSARLACLLDQLKSSPRITGAALDGTPPLLAFRIESSDDASKLTAAESTGEIP
jgi:hypothetical protein